VVNFEFKDIAIKSLSRLGALRAIITGPPIPIWLAISAIFETVIVDAASAFAAIFDIANAISALEAAIFETAITMRLVVLEFLATFKIVFVFRHLRHF